MWQILLLAKRKMLSLSLLGEEMNEEAKVDVANYTVPLFSHEERRVYNKDAESIILYLRDMGFWEVPECDVSEFTEAHKEQFKKMLEEKRAEEARKAREAYEHELWLLAHLVYAEGGGENFEFQIRVGNVALNRVESDLYPDTLEEVIFQAGQYSCTWLGGFYYEPSQTSWEAARWLLNGGRVFPKNVLYQAQFPQGDGTYEFRVNTYFCYVNIQ